jgi:acetate kinase
MANALLLLNAGSSSLKFSVYLSREPLELCLRGQIEGLTTQPRFTVCDGQGSLLDQQEWPTDTRLGHEGAVEFLLSWGRSGVLGDHRLIGAGHRVVHGGMNFTQPVLLDATSWRR